MPRTPRPQRNLLLKLMPLITHQPIPSDLTRYQARTNELLAEDGPFSTRLREQYENLGLLLQKAGEHEKAISAFENAAQIDRVNDGLYTPRQIPLIRNIIDSCVMQSNWQEAARQHEYLYMVQTRNNAPDTREGLAALEELADWNVQYYLNESAYRFRKRNKVQLSGNMTWLHPDYALMLNRSSGRYVYAPRARLTTILDHAGAFNSDPPGDFYDAAPAFVVSPEAMVDERLRRAGDIYRTIIDSPNPGFHTTHNARLEQKRANVGIAVKRQLDAIETGIDNLPPGSDDDDEDTLFNRLLVFPQSNNPVIQTAYASSRDSLQTIAEQVEQDGNSNALDTARAYINLGDWYLSFNYTQSSVRRHPHKNRAIPSRVAPFSGHKKGQHEAGLFILHL